MMILLVTFLTVVATILALTILLPTLVLFIESCVAVFKPVSQNDTPSIDSVRYAVLIPAHNESAVIANTLQSLRKQVATPTDIVVIADNCQDETAQIARSLGVTVLERYNQEKRGKGYALDYGLTHLEAAPPDVILMIDADTTIEEGGIAKLVAAAHTKNRPIQAVYLQRPATTPSMNDLVSAFAFRVKNLVRPMGLYQLGQPCLLTGSGMAFPWQIIRNAPLASGNIVEDMQLVLDLALAGNSPSLAHDVIVWGELPQQRSAATTQRTRWEHGHLHTLLTQVPRLLSGALRQKRIDLAALALDLMVPPLALLVLLWGLGGVIITLFGIITKIWKPAIIVGIAGSLLFSAIGAAWWRFGRQLLPFQKLIAIPLYVAWKIPLYIGFVARRQTSWVRTARDQAESADVHDMSRRNK